MPVPNTSGAQRVRYYDGQLLAAHDLRDDMDYDARLRGLHVRALHGVWGIALGYEVILAPDGKTLQVTQGMAYDCAGHELVMSATLLVDPPDPPRGSTAPAWWFDLLVRYPERAAFGSQGDGGDSCPTGEIDLLQERPVWRWSCAGDAPTPFVEVHGFAEDVRLGEEIPLARVRVTAEGKVTDLDRTVRRVARGLVRPHIAGGQVRQGSIPIQGSPWHWTAWIDTSAGGFNTSQPFYFATLVDHPWLSPTSGFAAITNELSLERKRQLQGPFIAIKASSRTGFTFDVSMATANIDHFESMPVVMHRSVGLTLPVAVNWLGIEPSGGCQPPMESRYFFLTGLLSRAAVAENQWCPEP